jgi:uncharacterized membrane protein YfhO
MDSDSDNTNLQIPKKRKNPAEKTTKNTTEAVTTVEREEKLTDEVVQEIQGTVGENVPVKNTVANLPNNEQRQKE